MQLRDAFLNVGNSCQILLAERDRTALAFLAAWNSSDFKPVRTKSNIVLASFNTASHSFADTESKEWLENQILNALKSA